MKRNVSVVKLCLYVFECACSKIIKELPVLVGSGLPVYIHTGVLIKSLARPGKKKSRKHVRDARDFNNIDRRAVIKFFSFYLQETLACFLPGRAKDLSAHLYIHSFKLISISDSDADSGK